ncbi:ester cyclase [Rhodococcus koreensis]
MPLAATAAAALATVTLGGVLMVLLVANALLPVGVFVFAVCALQLATRARQDDVAPTPRRYPHITNRGQAITPGHSPITPGRTDPYPRSLETVEEQPSAQKVDPACADEFVERWGTTWNAHDPAQLLELLTDDIVYHNSAWPTTMRGKADVREFLDHTWRAFPHLTFELIAGPHIAGGGARAAYWWQATATHQGPIDPPGIPVTGKHIEFDGVDIHKYRNHKIGTLRIICNMNDIAMQLGLLPAPGSTAEKVMIGMHKLRSRLTRS